MSSSDFECKSVPLLKKTLLPRQRCYYEHVYIWNLQVTFRDVCLLVSYFFCGGSGDISDSVHQWHQYSLPAVRLTHPSTVSEGEIRERTSGRKRGNEMWSCGRAAAARKRPNAIWFIFSKKYIGNNRSYLIREKQLHKKKSQEAMWWLHDATTPSSRMSSRIFSGRRTGWRRRFRPLSDLEGFRLTV